ncbi:MAG TPA: type I methionyl aminopeptidase [bacterium]
MIILKTSKEIEKIKKSCMIVMEILGKIKDHVAPGVRLRDLESIAEELLKKKNAKAAFKNYKGYPHSLCTSVNNVVVHGMPLKDKFLSEGDILSIDFGALYDGYYGDAAMTVPVGKVSSLALKLIKTAEEAVELGIGAAIKGSSVGDISNAIQTHVESKGFSVVRDFVGHGIGKDLHEDPQVPNFGRKNSGIELVEGMVLAIEPMINAGRSEVKVLDDGWTVVTEDESLSAHYEHCIAITEKGSILLTKI